MADSTSKGSSDEEEHDVIKETEELRRKSLEQLQEAIAMLPQADRVALEQARMTVPELVEQESNPLNFLRFHSFNSWAAAKRLAIYWKQRKDIFGERAFLPMDLSGNGAMPLDDIKSLLYGAFMLLPNDTLGRSVLYVDRSKLLEDENITSRSTFFLLQSLMNNKVSGRDFAVCLINLSNPFGAIFQRNNVALAKELLRKAMTLKKESVHVVCSPPSAMQGQNSFVSSFVPLCLQRMGKYFSKYVQVHVAESEGKVLQLLSAHNFRREGLPPSFGGTWDGFDDWLKSQKCTLDRKLHLDALVRNTLWAYSDGQGTSTDENSMQESDRPFSSAEENLLADRKKFEHFDIRDYMNATHSEMSPEERAKVLRDIYGTTNLEFTITREVEVEGRARAQFEEAIELLPDADRKDFLEAKEKVPHLVEIESDPIRYLRVEQYNTWNAARRVALYWKTRKEIFAERAFLPLALSGESALKQEEIAMIKTAYMTIMPNDKKGRPIYFHDLSRLTVPFTAESRTRCAFYIMQLISERESSRNVGAIGIAAYAKKAPRGATDPRHGRKATEMARDGVFPCHWRAIHVCAVGMKSSTLRDKYFVPFTLQMLRYWKALSFRTIIHVDETPQAIMDKIGQYSIPSSSVPTTIGGTWTYEHDFKKWLSERLEYEKSTYGIFESSHEKSKVAKASKSTATLNKDQLAQREKKRRMDALYARRKRERMRIEVEVLQEQCVVYNNKNSTLEKQNRWLEGLLRQAESMVDLHASGQVHFGYRGPPSHAAGFQGNFFQSF